MPDAPQPPPLPTASTSALRKIDIGVIVTLLLAIFGFAFYLGGLNTKVAKLDGVDDRFVKIGDFETKVNKLDPARIDAALSKAGSVPIGTIVAWYPHYTGGSIPSGWVVCDGSNKTPDLRGRFLRGVGSIADVEEARPSPAFSYSKTMETDGSKADYGIQNIGGNQLVAGSAHKHVTPMPPHFMIVFIMKL